MTFSQLPVYKRLQQLAKNPIDLTTHFTPDRVQEMKLEALGFKLLYGAERVTEDVMHALYELATETDALKKMAQMQSGEIINTGEGRAVLHTAMRDHFNQPQSAERAKEAAQMAKRELKKLEAFLSNLDGNFTDLVQIGIGGSDLGPRAIAIALEGFHIPGRRVHFISNVDPDDASAVLSKLNLAKTLVVVVSKSGSTLETLTNEEFVRAKMVKAGLNPKDHFLAVTGEKSPMDNPNRYLASFYMWDFVGGRYSATSMVGGVMLGFILGYSRFEEILKGAHDMDHHALTAPIEKNLPLTSALLGIWNRNFLKHETLAVIPYSQALLRFPAHLQQLDMESNGKRVDKNGQPVDFKTGPIVWGEPGTNGQHSFYQLIHQGTDIVPVEFIGFKESQRGEDLKIQETTSQQKLLSNLIAQSIALAQGQHNPNENKVFTGNRPNRMILAEKLTPYALGALLALYEHKVAFQGFIWGINSFDQEGVQLGKVLAAKVLGLLSKKGEAFALGQAYVEGIGL